MTIILVFYSNEIKSEFRVVVGQPRRCRKGGVWKQSTPEAEIKALGYVVLYWLSA
jgi:hypothetical protein